MKDRSFEIARNCRYDGYQRALASMIYKFFDKKTELGISVNNTGNKPVIKKLKTNKQTKSKQIKKAKETSMRYLKTTFGQLI